MSKKDLEWIEKVRRERVPLYKPQPGEPDHAEEERGIGQPVHQPAHRDSCQPCADERYALAAKIESVVSVVKCSKGMSDAG